MWTNCKWLIDRFDHLHQRLGLKQSGGWIRRVEQVVQAVEATIKANPSPNAGELLPCPFCGTPSPTKEADSGYPGQVMVVCSNARCRATMHEAWEHATAEENWNQRVVQILVAGRAAAKPAGDAERRDSAYCPNCGGKMHGDGYTTVRHCEEVEGTLEIEPDAATVYCATGQVVLVALEDDQLVLHKDGEWADSLVVPRPFALAFWERYKLQHLPSRDAWQDELREFLDKYPPHDEGD
jgi:endogenous inhibitor of DNA gyrase (YacG/DUF329 family)